MTDIPPPGVPNVESIQNPQQWAELQLAFMGLPTTNENVTLLVSWAAMEGGNWHNTAAHNPLNTTQQMPGSTVMSGGNTAGVQSYGTWMEGLQATAKTLGGYPQIMRALQAGNGMNANDQGQLASDFLKWSGGGYSQIGENTAYATTTGGPANAAGGGTVAQAGAAQPAGQPPVGTPPPNIANDPAQLDQWIRTNQPSYAWLLDVDPQVKQIVEQQIAAGNANNLMPYVQQTEWWKTTSDAVKQYYTNLASNPAEYSFTVPGSTASQTLANIQADAAKAGVTLQDSQAQQIATDALKWGWQQTQIQQAIGSMASYTAAGQSNAGGLAQQLQALAGQYLIDVSPQVMQSWVQNVAAGTQTTQQFQSYLANTASLKWTGLAPQIQAGYTTNQIVDNLRQEAAKTMEVSPDQVDFVKNPFYGQILDYAPPDSTNGVHRVMTTSEMDKYLKSSDQWGYTQQARDQSASLDKTITTAFGKVG